MRHVLAAILTFAIGAPAAFALPTAGSASVAATKSDTIVQIAKRSNSSGSRSRSQRQSNSGDGGIHPLVGSGGY